jgi:hypothetical protein
MVAVATENDRASCPNQPHSSITNKRKGGSNGPAMEGEMTKPGESGERRFGAHERPDLRKEYRPIGIGAVAAALSVTGKDLKNGTQPRQGEDEDRRADNDRGGHRSFLAA